MITRKRINIEVSESGTCDDMISLASNLEATMQALLDGKAERVRVQWVDIQHKGEVDYFTRGFAIVAERGKMTEQELAGMRGKFDAVIAGMEIKWAQVIPKRMD
jgi:hypothetical protein